MSDETSVKIGGKDYVLRPLTLDQLEQYLGLVDGNNGGRDVRFLARAIKFILANCCDEKDAGKLFVRFDEMSSVMEAFNKLNGLITQNPPPAAPPAAS